MKYKTKIIIRLAYNFSEVWNSLPFYNQVVLQGRGFVGCHKVFGNLILHLNKNKQQPKRTSWSEKLTINLFRKKAPFIIFTVYESWNWLPVAVRKKFKSSNFSFKFFRRSIWYPVQIFYPKYFCFSSVSFSHFLVQLILSTKILQISEKAYTFFPTALFKTIYFGNECYFWKYLLCIYI